MGAGRGCRSGGGDPRGRGPRRRRAGADELAPLPAAGRSSWLRWTAYLVAGGVATALVGAWVVLVLLACGAVELAVRVRPEPGATPAILPASLVATGAVTGGVLLSVAWVALKVGALSYGGGFVIIRSCRSTPSTTTTGSPGRG